MNKRRKTNGKLNENIRITRIRQGTRGRNLREPWLVGKDIAEALGYKETANMRKVLDAYDYREIDPQSSEFTGFVQNGSTLEPNKNIRRMLLINESGMYQAVTFVVREEQWEDDN